jgi:hypothetical protein
VCVRCAGNILGGSSSPRAQARAPGHGAGGVADELRKFKTYGMLAETPDGRRVYFTPTSSPLWSAFRAIVASVEEVHAEATGRHGR